MLTEYKNTMLGKYDRDNNEESRAEKGEGAMEYGVIGKEKMLTALERKTD